MIQCGLNVNSNGKPTSETHDGGNGKVTELHGKYLYPSSFGASWGTMGGGSGRGNSYKVFPDHNLVLGAVSRSVPGSRCTSSSCGFTWGYQGGASPPPYPLSSSRLTTMGSYTYDGTPVMAITHMDQVPPPSTHSHNHTHTHAHFHSTPCAARLPLSKWVEAEQLFAHSGGAIDG